MAMQHAEHMRMMAAMTEQLIQKLAVLSEKKEEYKTEVKERQSVATERPDVSQTQEVGPRGPTGISPVELESAINGSPPTEIAKKLNKEVVEHLEKTAQRFEKE
eukprot:759233_1